MSWNGCDERTSGKNYGHEKGENEDRLLAEG